MTCLGRQVTLLVRSNLCPIRWCLYLAFHQITCLRRCPPLRDGRRPRLPFGQPLLARLLRLVRARDRRLLVPLFLQHLLLRH